MNGPPHHTKRTVAYGLFLLASVLYIWGLAPTIYWRDSAEFVTAVHILGTTHPAGSPTYTLLAKVLTFLPLGSIAVRVNLFSALCGGLAVSLLFSVLYDLLPASAPRVRLGAAISGALFLLVSESFWRFSEVAEVYTLQNALLLGLSALLLKARTRTWAQPQHFTFYWLFAFFYGLSAGVHATMAFFVPAFFAFIVLSEPRLLRGKVLAFAFFFFLLGFAIFLYLPLRSLSEPALDWGDTETFRQLLIHMTDRKDAPVHFGFPLARLPFQIHVYLANLANEFSTLGMLLGLIGCVALWFRDKPSALLLLLVFLGNVGFFVRSWTAAFGFIPSFVVFALWIGYGTYMCCTCLALLYQRHQIRFPRVVVSACILGGIILTLGQSFSRHLNIANQAENYSAELYGKQLLEQLPPNAMLFSGFSWFPLLYLQQVERWRPDFTLLLQSEVFVPSQFAYLSQERFPNIQLVTSTELVQMSTVDYFWQLCELNKQDHPLFWDADKQFQVMFDNYLRPEGLLLAFTPRREVTLTPEILRAHESLLIDSTHRILSETSDKEAYDFLSGQLNLIGLYFRRLGLDDEAAKMYRAGLSLGPDRFDLLGNYGGVLLSQGRIPEALEQLNAAYREAPVHPVINRNLGLLLLKGGDHTQAAYFFERAIRFEPTRWEVHALLSETYIKLDRLPEAMQALQRARVLIEDSSLQDNVKKRAQGDIQAQIGAVHLKLGHFPEATEALRAALTYYEQVTAQPEPGTHLLTIIAWAQENLRYLEQGLTTRLLPHPFLWPASPPPM